MIVVKQMDYLSEPSVKFVSAHSTSYCWPKWCAWNFSFDAGWLKIKRTFFLSHSMRKYDCLYGKTETFIYFYSSIQSNGRHFAGKWSRKNVEKKSLIKVGKTIKNTTHTHTHQIDNKIYGSKFMWFFGVRLESKNVNAIVFAVTQIILRALSM